MELKKLERWCDAVRPRAEKTLPSSLNTPTATALLSSETLNVLTLPSPCATVAESVSDNEGERDGEEDGGEEDDDDSDNDLEIVLEQSGTANRTGAASGGTEAPAKKAKITWTEEELCKEVPSCCVQNRKRAENTPTTRLRQGLLS